MSCSGPFAARVIVQRRVLLQEYGEDAPAPNKNTVYLAYLDSVKHFRPEEKDSGGTALRTMVYQEVLLAYIDRAAMLGMNSIYIWSCPPLAVRSLFVLHPRVGGPYRSAVGCPI